jgi:simple sugar transport system permease protein
MKSNFIITGFGINIFVAALSSFVLKYMAMANINVSSIVNTAGLKINIPIIKDIPILNSLLSGHTAITYLSIILIAVVTVIMYNTKFGVYEGL